MAKKEDFRTVEIENDQLEAIEAQVRAHKRKNMRMIFMAFAVIAVIAVMIQLWNALRSFSTYEVVRKTERGDSMAVRYESFLGKRIEYSNDGIICTDTEENLVWNQAFEMNAPNVDICDRYLAVYDKGGTSIYVMTENGLSKKIETQMPVSRVRIAAQGSVAVLMQEDRIAYVRLYDRKGKELANGKFYEEKGAFPVDIALSADARKLAVDIVDIGEGKVSSTISFYNFGSVGQNEINNNVGTYTYEDLMIPEIDYVSADRMVAFTDKGFITYEGAQKPVEKRTIEYDSAVQSLFHNNKYVGIAYSNPESQDKTHIKVYDMNGGTVMENDTEILYDRIEFLDNNEVCVRDAYHLELFTMHSIRKFRTTFDKSLYKVLSGVDNQNYTFVLESETDEVRLR